MTTLTSLSNSKPEGYGAGMIVLLVALATIIGALGFEYIGGYIPCPLCLQQRYAYYAGVPAAFLALVLLSIDQRRLAGLIFFLLAIGFVANAGLGIYQSGAEWKFWPGPDSCGGGQAITNSAADLMASLEQTSVIRCDEASWRFAGLSFAGWNTLISLVLFGFSIVAASISFRRA